MTENATSFHNGVKWREMYDKNVSKRIRMNNNVTKETQQDTRRFSEQ